VSCEKMAESIAIQFGIMSGVGPGDTYYMGI